MAKRHRSSKTGKLVSAKYAKKHKATTVTEKVKKRIGPADSTVRKSIRELRQIVDCSIDPYEQQIAYAMETALIWARRKTVGWPSMANKAKLLASLLRKETGHG